MNAILLPITSTNPSVPLLQDDNLDVTTYVVHILEKNSVQIPDLSPGTFYLFRVQALGSDGTPGGSGVEEVFETSRGGTEEMRRTRKQKNETCHFPPRRRNSVMCCFFSALFSRTSYSEPHRRHPHLRGCGGGPALHGGSGAVPAPTVSILWSVCLATAHHHHHHQFPLSSPTFPSCGGLRMASAFTPSSPLSPSPHPPPPTPRLSLSLSVDLCPPRHSLGARICHECALSLLNARILQSVGSLFSPPCLKGNRCRLLFLFFLYCCLIRGARFLLFQAASHFVKVTRGRYCSRLQARRSLRLPPSQLVRLSLFYFSLKMGLANTLCPQPFIQSLLLCEWAQCSEVRVPLEGLRTSLKKKKTLPQRLLCAIDIKVAT